MSIKTIIFSKNRTLQLKSLLLSLRENSDFDEKACSIIYKADPGLDYEPLKQEFDCEFIEQGDFLADVKNAVSSSRADYFMFMVDDLICRDKVDFAMIEKLLNERADIDAFTLRLGKNIKCGQEPEFTELKNDILLWDTRDGQGRHWNYFWEMCCTIYRRPLVEEYLSKCRDDKETFPNPFESHYYSCMPSSRKSKSMLVRLVNGLRFMFKRQTNRVACYRKSRCFTQGVNLVADIGQDREEFFDPESLHKKMLEGYIVDFKSIRDAENEVPNPGREYFKLVKLDGTD